MLFVPGHKRDWMLKAHRYDSDALILDLEDAVPIADKAQARIIVGEVIDTLGPGRPHLFVRVNSWDSGLLLRDVASVVRPALAGIMLSKTDSPHDVIALDYALSSSEIETGLPAGSIEIMPLLETARGMRDAYSIYTASSRIRRITGAGAYPPGGDITRAVGYRPSADESETLYLASKRVLDARAAGITNIMCAWGPSFEDMSALRRSVERARQLGANGATAIHPCQIAVMNELFSPSPEELAEAAKIMAVMSDAIALGHSAARMGKIMVDYAHVRSARALLTWARNLGLDVPAYPDVEVLD